MPPKLVTVAEAQALLAVKSTTLFGMLATGRLTRVKICGRTLITVESIDKLIEAGIAAANADLA